MDKNRLSGHWHDVGLCGIDGSDDDGGLVGARGDQRVVVGRHDQSVDGSAVDAQIQCR